MRCQFWIWCSIIIIAAANLGRSRKSPNVIFILADDYGFNDIGYHARNHESAMKTPFLDHLAAEGIKLENYYVQPICTPTRSQLLSGRYQIHTGLQHGIIWPSQPNALPIENILLPEQLRECGYDTHMIGKWHLGFYEEKFLPWNRGFNSYYGYLEGGEDYYTHQSCYKGMCGIDMYDSKYGAVNDTWGEYSTHLFTRKAIQTIDNRDESKPFFLYLAYQSVHSPMEVPSKYTAPFEHIKDDFRRIYAGMVLAMDESVYNITEHLKNLSLLQDTIIIFSTDNGGQTMSGGNNWPLRGRKGTLWEGGVKGIGFIYGEPLQLKGNTYKGLLHISDWYPTILEATKCPIINGTQSLDGYNQWGAILQKTRPTRNELLHNIDPMNIVKGEKPPGNFDTRVRAAVRKGKWKLLTGHPGFDEWVKPPESLQLNVNEDVASNSHSENFTYLFDIESDPYEHKNVASQYPQVVEDLLSVLAKYNSTSVPVHYPKMDPDADPKYHNGFWGPWIKN